MNVRQVQLAMMLAALWNAVAGAAIADLNLASVFCDGLVLQQGVELPVWGTGVPGAVVEISFAGQSVSTLVDERGQYRGTLKPCVANAIGTKLTVVSADNTLIVHDVLVGEVWLAAGQSNMQMTIQSMLSKLSNSAPSKRSVQLASAVASPDQPQLRVLRVNEPVAGGRRADFGSSVTWQKCDAESVKGFSAVVWVFANRLHTELNVPVGVIDVSWGGKPIEPFIPAEAFAEHVLLTEIKRLADHEQLKQLAGLEGGVIIRNPEGFPGAIYDARIRPLQGFGLSGFLWYQAESNCGNGEDPRGYRHKMRALINGWRLGWNNPNLPMYFVQLPNYRPEAFGWIRMREEQRRSLNTANTAMVVAIDTGSEDIHPANKVDIGERLAMVALHRNYGRNIVDSGPIFRRHVVSGSDVTVHFSSAADGLMLAAKRGLEQAVENTNQHTLPHFELAAADGVWHPAAVRISGNTVTVSSKHVTDPLEVRYACRNDPSAPLLYNRSGLPASPFCSRLEWLPWQPDIVPTK